MKLNKREEMVSKGIVFFIIKKGIMGWGISAAILYTVISYVMDYGFYVSSLSISEFIEQLIISFFVFPIGGILFGIVMWQLINKQKDKK